MNREIHKVNSYFVKPYVILTSVIILICSVLWFIPPLSEILDGDLNYYQLIVPIVFAVLFRFTVGRLPYTTKKRNLSNINGFDVFSLTLLIGVTCSYHIAMTINYASKEIIKISKVDDVVNYPNIEYFLLDEGLQEPALIETSYFTTTSSDRGVTSFHIGYLYGGAVGYDDQIFIFSTGTYLYGREYSAIEEWKTSKLANKIEKSKFHSLSKDGGYICRLSESKLIELEDRISETAFKKDAHIAICSNPREFASMIVLFVFAFGLMTMFPALHARYSKDRGVIHSSVDGQNKYLKKLFNSKENIERF